MSEPAAEHDKLADNIVHFARTLRAAGLPVGPAAIVDAIRAVETAGLSDREDFYWTLHAVFVNKRDQRPVFDEAFRLFWRPRGLVEKLLQMLSPVAPQRGEPEKPKPGAGRVAQAMLEGQEPRSERDKPQIEIEAHLTVSGSEVLRSLDFAQMTAEEVARAKREIAKLILPANKVRTRRFVASQRGQRIDARRTMRASLRGGGDVISLRWQKRLEVHPPLVALCDISGSMSKYTRLFLHFLHALTERRKRVHTFLFGTRLTNITRQLRMRDPDEALEACSDLVPDWSGGTRIATALHDFNRHWSRRVLSQNPIVLLITDGLERDSEEDLAHEIDRLHRSCRRLVWLNPLLRYEGFEARAAGIRRMLPHVDEFRAIHSLDAMSDLCAALSRDRPPGNWDPRQWRISA